MEAKTEALLDTMGSPEALALASALTEAKERKRLGIHAFHRWYGKLIPAIPAAAIEAFSAPGDLVVDPFTGSGTVAVEARAAGRAAEGTDVNPLSILLARVKTRAVDPTLLQAASERIHRRVTAGDLENWRDELPAIVNLENFYPDPVAKGLAQLMAASRQERQLGVREWFTALVSAISRDVSNADTRHVFPGVSKRMKALIAEGWQGDVAGRWRRAVKKRLASATEYHALAADAPEAVFHEAPASSLAGSPGRAALFVTNPPYVSSVRWVETFRHEAQWLGLCEDRDALQALDRKMLGTERVPKTLLEDEEIELSPRCCHAALRELRAAEEHKRARIAQEFLVGLGPSLRAASATLRVGGHALVKIAPSKLRGVSIPTPEACVAILEEAGVHLVGTVQDDYMPNSRSLTTARNWYSGRIDSDVLMLFCKRAP